MPSAVFPAPFVDPHLRGALLSWYTAARRPLPWRQTRDPYAIWVSEVMLQQTQVATVIPYWQRFLERFPSFEALASAPLEDVLGLWRGLGYYRRARALHDAAKEVVARFGGRLPADATALASLPSFGPYTVGAVASIAFEQPVPLVDGNVARVFSRLFEVEGAQGDRTRDKQLWSLAAALVVGERPGDWNQALMELGATICRPEAPLCLLCPVRVHCAGFRSGRVDELPPPKVRAARKSLVLASGLWQRGGQMLVAKRTEGGLFGGLWELPSATLPPGRERRVEATEVHDALRAQLGIPLALGRALGTVQRTLTHRDLTLHLWQLEGTGEPLVLPPYAELSWKRPGELPGLGISTAMQRALDMALGDSDALLSGKPAA